MSICFKRSLNCDYYNYIYLEDELLSLFYIDFDLNELGLRFIYIYIHSRNKKIKRYFTLIYFIIKYGLCLSFDIYFKMKYDYYMYADLL